MNTLTLQVQENLHVQVLPNPQHEFLMTTNEVANGYGVSCEYSSHQKYKA